MTPCEQSLIADAFKFGALLGVANRPVPIEMIDDPDVRAGIGWGRLLVGEIDARAVAYAVVKAKAAEAAELEVQT